MNAASCFSGGVPWPNTGTPRWMVRMALRCLRKPDVHPHDGKPTWNKKTAREAFLRRSAP